ncbi:NF038120 family PEP-CTERM protein [Aquabacterium sp. A7-Y]|uniref:NF038120 family PEP-CTERM protein n=1 Tax=Aquabacterium sp. A7-Y TaxID=1349605 RepID=UPI00223DC110|nr:NF038120 family PEP-CTERM protein [Aquabacterium sp. A7-Y]MCW7541060.1 NF038120 family PEP-CTERM protein [Aquabacterium sp. A7-Y]
MSKKLSSRSLAALLALCASALLPAQAEVLDFEAVAPGLYADGEDFQQDGWRFSVGGDFGSIDSAAGCFIVVCPSGNDTQFYGGFNDSRLVLERSDGGAFSLLGFDAALVAPLKFGSGVAGGQLVLQATTTAGARVFSSWDLGQSGADGSFAFQSFAGAALGAFGAVSSIDFFACIYGEGGACLNPSGNLGQFALDNLSLVPVPEPGSVVLLALGLGGLAGFGRRAGAGARSAA